MQSIIETHVGQKLWESVIISGLKLMVQQKEFQGKGQVQGPASVTVYLVKCLDVRSSRVQSGMNVEERRGASRTEIG